MKQKITYLSFSILLLLLFSPNGFANKTEKDKTDKNQTTKVVHIEQASHSIESAINDKTANSDMPMKSKLNQSTLSTNAGEEINWLVISSGGVRGTSTDLVLTNTIGQSAVVLGTTTDYQYNGGFWQNFINNYQSCCIADRGNIDGGPDDGTLANSLDIEDLVYLVDFMFRAGPSVVCFEEADIDGSGEEPLDIEDLVFLVDFMFRAGPPPLPCP